MNITFKAKIWMKADFIDFLMHLLKPSKIIPFYPISWGSDASIRIEGARLISMTEFERELIRYHKTNGGDGDIDFEVKSLELMENEKTQVVKIITFEKVMH